jgi:hypothetical protein
VNGRTTQLLIVLVALALVCAMIGGIRLNDARRSAISRADDLQAVRDALADIARHGGGPLKSPSAISSNDPELNRRLRAAAVAAGVADQLTSVEPGQPARLRDGDFVETPVFLRLDGATLRGTVGMLSRLCADDPSITVKSIELSPPQTAPAPVTAAPAETWTADLTVAYLVYSPKR